MTVGWDTATEVQAWPGLPPLPGDASADVCVVGLGASGLAAVEAAAERGLSVIGLDAGRVGAMASGRNGGFLLGGPAHLHQAVREWGAAAFDLYRATLAEIDRLASELPGAVRRAGSIRLAGWPGEPDADELADCVAQAALLREAGIAVDDYDGPLGRGLFLPDDAQVNPAVRAVATATRLAGRAALHEHTRVTSVSAGAVRTERGRVSAGAVVVAVDGRLDVLVPELAGRVRTARLQMLATEPVAPGRAPCPVYGRWGYDYAQQDPSGRLLVGGGRQHHEADEWTADAEPTEAVQAWIERAAATIAGEPVRVTHRWAAPVGFTADGRPLCVRVHDGPSGGVVCAGGYSGTGNLVGPVTARAAVAYATDGTPPPSWTMAR
ncbi:NAD(P)/FAD-dependent oxidoreductase [Jatrophihabitans fulvus]